MAADVSPSSILMAADLVLAASVGIVIAWRRADRLGLVIVAVVGVAVLCATPVLMPILPKRDAVDGPILQHLDAIGHQVGGVQEGVTRIEAKLPPPPAAPRPEPIKDAGAMQPPPPAAPPRVNASLGPKGARRADQVWIEMQSPDGAITITAGAVRFCPEEANAGGCTLGNTRPCQDGHNLVCGGSSIQIGPKIGRALFASIPTSIGGRFHVQTELDYAERPGGPCRRLVVMSGPIDGARRAGQIAQGPGAVQPCEPGRT
jgi:hypothetical protein